MDIFLRIDTEVFFHLDDKNKNNKGNNGKDHNNNKNIKLFVHIALSS